MQRGMKDNDFLPISRFIWEMVQYRAIVTMQGEYETASQLSNGTNLNASSRGPVPVLAAGVFPLPAPGSGTASRRNCNGQTLSLANSVDH